ncbi:MAG: hypothetical protein GX231_03545 [Tissierellia bacterium]|nr:hypothetical protein [Tissierellia bacterium]
MRRKTNKKILIICILLVILSIGFSRKEEIQVNEKHKLLEYYPQKEMIKIFRDDLGNKGFTQIVDKIENNKVQIKQIDELTSVVMIYEIKEDYIKLIFTEEVGENKFKEDYIKELNPNRNDFIIKAPIKVGTKWHDNLGGYYEIIKTDAIVKTSLDEFEAIVVRYKNDDFTVKEYYSKDLGLVKIVVNNFSAYQLEEINFEWKTS